MGSFKKKIPNFRITLLISLQVYVKIFMYEIMYKIMPPDLRVLGPPLARVHPWWHERGSVVILMG